MYQSAHMFQPDSRNVVQNISRKDIRARKDFFPMIAEQRLNKCSIEFFASKNKFLSCSVRFGCMQKANDPS